MSVGCQWVVVIFVTKKMVMIKVVNDVILLDDPSYASNGAVQIRIQNVEPYHMASQ